MHFSGGAFGTPGNSYDFMVETSTERLYHGHEQDHERRRISHREIAGVGEPYVPKAHRLRYTDACTKRPDPGCDWI